MDIEFKNVSELYNRVMPALRFKKRMLLKKGIKISEKEIFEYLIEMKWSNGFNLTLNDIVSDIINAELKSIK